MEDATQLALRAIVGGLYHSRVIGEDQVLAIMHELHRAAEDRGQAGHPVDQQQLMALSSAIGKDARVGD
ncbi:MAG TPA: hypothetical protein VF631_05190 [Allosphingosinicella sp.]|jgi:3-hydroxyacyl-CoA dehydrogenase|uniref:hypothetical protein n=1 Tax=Allosphingosinicella sp. TaxID=2823234 RepID=UPI002F28E535